MTIYWMLLIVCPLLAVLGQAMPRRMALPSGRIVQKPNIFYAFMSMFVIVFFIGLRSGIADTGAYISGFISLPEDDFLGILLSDGKDRGFALFTYVMKYYVYDDFHVYLFTITAFSCYAVGKSLYRYSANYALSMFLFISSGQFTYLLNGLRQFIVVSGLFMCFHLIFHNKKKYLFILITVLLSTIHGSALFMIPIFFFCNTKPFSLINTLAFIGFIIANFALEQFFNSFDTFVKSTQYEQYSQLIKETPGSHFLRLFVAAIPPVLCFWKRKEIADLNNTVMNFCVNMSIYNLGFMILSTSMGGLFIGRIAVYCDIFNLLLYPMITSMLYRGSNRLFLYSGIITCFTVWFYYLIVATWDLQYVSDILGLSTYQ